MVIALLDFVVFGDDDDTVIAVVVAVASAVVVSVIDDDDNDVVVAAVLLVIFVGEYHVVVVAAVVLVIFVGEDHVVVVVDLANTHQKYFSYIYPLMSIFISPPCEWNVKTIQGLNVCFRRKNSTITRKIQIATATKVSTLNVLCKRQ